MWPNGDFGSDLEKQIKDQPESKVTIINGVVKQDGEFHLSLTDDGKEWEGKVFRKPQVFTRWGLKESICACTGVEIR